MTGCARVKLPDRRHHVTVKTAFDGRRLYVSYGLHPETGALREVFLRGATGTGAGFQMLLDDVGTLVSHLLQRGATAAELAKGVGRLGGYPYVRGAPGTPAQAGDEQSPPEPASVVGFVLDLLAAEDAALHGGKGNGGIS